jgi:hypothetical protein
MHKIIALLLLVITLVTVIITTDTTHCVGNARAFQLCAAPAAEWQKVIADPENFSADCGAWIVPAGSVVNTRYKIAAPDELVLLIQATTVAPASGCEPTALKWRLPDGQVTASEFLTPIILWHDERFEVGLAQAPAPGMREILLQRLNGQWRASSDRTYVWAQIHVPIAPAKPQ